MLGDSELPEAALFIWANVCKPIIYRICTSKHMARISCKFLSRPKQMRPWRRFQREIQAQVLVPESLFGLGLVMWRENRLAGPPDSHKLPNKLAHRNQTATIAAGRLTLSEYATFSQRSTLHQRSKLAAALFIFLFLILMKAADLMKVRSFTS